MELMETVKIKLDKAHTAKMIADYLMKPLPRKESDCAMFREKVFKGGETEYTLSDAMRSVGDWSKFSKGLFTHHCYVD